MRFGRLCPDLGVNLPTCSIGPLPAVHSIGRQRQAETAVWFESQGVEVGEQLLTGVALTAEHSPLPAQKHSPATSLAVRQHTVPEQVLRLPLASVLQSQSPAF